MVEGDMVEGDMRVHDDGSRKEAYNVFLRRKDRGTASYSQHQSVRTRRIRIGNPERIVGV